MAVLPTASDGLENLEREKYSHFFLRKERLMPLLFAAIKQKAKLGGLAALRIFFGLYRPCNFFVFFFAVSPCRWLLSPRLYSLLY